MALSGTNDEQYAAAAVVGGAASIAGPTVAGYLASFATVGKVGIAIAYGASLGLALPIIGIIGGAGYLIAKHFSK